jgi:hypothetical protein
VFAWLHRQSLHARSSSLVDWLYEQMQANHAMRHDWLPEYKHIPFQSPLSLDGEVTTSSFTSTKIT